MDASVVVCTFNRADDLRRTLEQFCRLQVPSTLNWELILSDNNSSDHTSLVCEEFAKCLPLRRLFAPTQGKTHALNLAVREARSELLLFTDDDVDVDENWLVRMHAAALAHPEADFFGGRIRTRWEVSPPAWVLENYDWLTPFPRYDLGESLLFLHDNKNLFVGANMAIRRRIFADGTSYHSELGPCGDSRSSSARHGGEEGELQVRLLGKGLRGLYVPDCVVHHRERPYRMTRKYVRWYFRECGREARLREGFPQASRVWFGVPRYLWRSFGENVLTYVRNRWRGDSKIWLGAECELAKTIGDMFECRDLHKLRSGIKCRPKGIGPSQQI